MVLYRFIHTVSENFALAVFWLYVMAFIGGLFLIFVFPPAPLMLVFLGLLMLVPALIGSKVLGAIDHALARRAIDRNICPQCQNISEGQASSDQTWQCSHCDAAYLRNGVAIHLADSVTP